ncbi:hypothetical protein TPA0910_47080 [Streptomyces hygroscopicus subsp. sporocinereus]|uniref:DUF8175 domain-containing protein n=1 Tax=Streptomyces hygroscopicus TaxID=1912 RepID=A0ABQ3U3X4_STRHY|nr:MULTISPECIES: hypothetical protein [Streptomyces]MCO8306571.1 hypothetical protein [Streptomyces sp. RKCA744]MDN3060665.1 hypothetical protein [Streptomyces sp. SRF1]GHJ30275.1 hypothetical protein TPA0910_47080 [Streptomyces hygroscopicus]
MSLGGDDGYGGDYEGHEPRRARGAASEGHLTRTRLPEGDGDPYGPPRRAPGRAGKPSRNLITVVGVVVLLLAAIAFVNRGGGKDGDSSNGDTGGTGTKARPTAPTGERPVEGKDNTTGIASGFAKSAQGAQSAAANYAVALGSDGMFKADRREAIVNAVYAPDVAAARLSELNKAFSNNKIFSNAGLDDNGDPPDGMTFVSRANPVGAKVLKFKDDEAQIAVWHSLLFGLAGEGSKNPVAESWYTDTFKLKWIKGDWKVTQYTQKTGPAPVGRDQAASSAEDMANAVQGFGGFTYAR